MFNGTSNFGLMCVCRARVPSTPQMLSWIGTTSPPFHETERHVLCVGKDRSSPSGRRLGHRHVVSTTDSRDGLPLVSSQWNFATTSNKCEHNTMWTCEFNARSQAKAIAINTNVDPFHTCRLGTTPTPCATELPNHSEEPPVSHSQRT